MTVLPWKVKAGQALQEGSLETCCLQKVTSLFMAGPVELQVEEISLQNCILKRWDGARIWYPNTVMLAAPVINMARSDCKWESFTVYLPTSKRSQKFRLKVIWVLDLAL